MGRSMMSGALRFSAVGLAIAYILLSVAVVAIVVVPLWYGWRDSIEYVRYDVLREDAQSLENILERQGIDALTSLIQARVDAANTVQRTEHPQPGEGDRRVINMIIFLTDSDGNRLAGNLSAPPQEALATGGMFTSTVQIDGRPVDALLLHTSLPGGYELLVGRTNARFERLETAFEDGLAGAISVILLAGLLGGFIVRRTLFAQVHRLNDTTSAIVEGDLTKRLPAGGGTSELDILAQTINRMLDQIEQLVHGVLNVSNAIAHDLRTPLAELRARLELLLVTRPSTEQTLGEIEGALADIDRVIGIFNALLRLAEIETGARRSGFAEVDVAAVAREAVDFYQPVAELKGIALTCSCASNVAIAGDFLLLSQAIGNLIDNAIKYGARNGRIDVEAVSRGESVHVTVADNGPGIAPEEIPKVTERFYRGDRSRCTPGVGLGLSLVAAVARLHGGTLGLSDNRPGLRATLVLGPKLGASSPG